MSTPISLDMTIGNSRQSYFTKWSKVCLEMAVFTINNGFLTAQMSVFMVFCGPHLPLAFQFVCGPGGGGGPQTNWKASGRFLFVWLRRRSRPRNTVYIVVFVRGPLLKTLVPLGMGGVGDLFDPSFPARFPEAVGNNWLS